MKKLEKMQGDGVAVCSRERDPRTYGLRRYEGPACGADWVYGTDISVWRWQIDTHNTGLDGEAAGLFSVCPRSVAGYHTKPDVRVHLGKTLRQYWQEKGDDKQIALMEGMAMLDQEATWAWLFSVMEPGVSDAAYWRAEVEQIKAAGGVAVSCERRRFIFAEEQPESN